MSSRNRMISSSAAQAILAAVTGLLMTAATAQAVELLDLNNYLEQVRTKNRDYRALTQASEAARARATETDLLFAPTLQAEVQLASGQPLQGSQALPGVDISRNLYSLGIAKQTRFGLKGKLAVNTTYFGINGLDSAAAGAIGLAGTQYYDVHPSLELSQPILFRNNLGREIRAQEDAGKAQALAASYEQRYRARLIEAAAEAAYWRLAAAQDLLRIQRDTLDRAGKMKDWNVKRVNLRLADRSDLLQTESVVQLRTLELQGAMDELRSAAQAFNAARGIEADQVPETLVSLTKVQMPVLALAANPPLRDDLQASFHAYQAADAASRLGEERNKPFAEIYASAGLNSRAVDIGDIASDSSQNTIPTAVGFRLTMPLAFGAQSNARQAYRLEAESAQARLDRRIFDQKREWDDLRQRYLESRKRVELARSLESVQLTKYRNEQDRHARGRTTTYMVLQFEQDYAQSQISRLRAEAEALGIVAQLKVFGTLTGGAK